MNVIKRFSVLLIVVGFTFFTASCTDEMPAGNVHLQITAAGNTNFSTGRIGGRTEADVEITDFRISIREVELEAEGVEYDDNSGQGSGDDSNEYEFEIEFEGPFHLDLLNSRDVILETIGNIEVPNGLYDEIEFDFHKGEDLPPSDPLYDRSIYIAGFIEGTPFIMWHDTSEELEIEFEDGLLISDNSVNVTITFTIDQFMNSLHTIDLSEAVDGNQDGLIEIHPNDPDGNKEIAELLKQNIKEAADLLEDDD